MGEGDEREMRERDEREREMRERERERRVEKRANYCRKSLSLVWTVFETHQCN